MFWICWTPSRLRQSALAPMQIHTIWIYSVQTTTHIKLFLQILHFFSKLVITADCHRFLSVFADNNTTARLLRRLSDCIGMTLSIACNTDCAIVTVFVPDAFHQIQRAGEATVSCLPFIHASRVPRKAQMLRTPTELHLFKASSASDLVWLEQVKCMLATHPDSLLAMKVKSNMNSKVNTPAPHLKSTNIGFKAFIQTIRLFECSTTSFPILWGKLDQRPQNTTPARSLRSHVNAFHTGARCSSSHDHMHTHSHWNGHPPHMPHSHAHTQAFVFPMTFNYCTRKTRGLLVQKAWTLHM